MKQNELPATVDLSSKYPNVKLDLGSTFCQVALVDKATEVPTLRDCVLVCQMPARHGPAESKDHVLYTVEDYASPNWEKEDTELWPHDVGAFFNGAWRDETSPFYCIDFS